MKKYYSVIIISISFILIVSTLAFYYSYTKKIVLDKENVQTQVEDNNEKNNEKKGMYVSTDQTNVVTSKTVYELIIEDRIKNTTNSSNYDVPVELIGLNRQEVIDYYNDYLNNPSLDEINAGLISCELISFSTEKVVVKKVYDGKIAKDKFFIIEEGGFVTVYYQDKKSVFEYTRISVNYLNKEEINRLKEGFYVENEEKLYSILESYSS